MYLYGRWFYKKDELQKELEQLIVTNPGAEGMSEGQLAMNMHLRELLNHPIWTSIGKRERILTDHIHTFTADGIESKCFYLHNFCLSFLKSLFCTLL